MTTAAHTFVVDDGGDGWGDELRAWMFDDDQAEVDQINAATAVDVVGPGTRRVGSPVELSPARVVGGDGDLSIHGGAATINQYLAAGLVDELRRHVDPLTLGAGAARLFEGVPPLRLEQRTSHAAASAMHVTCRASRPSDERHLIDLRYDHARRTGSVSQFPGGRAARRRTSAVVGEGRPGGEPGVEVRR